MNDSSFGANACAVGARFVTSLLPYKANGTFVSQPVFGTGGASSGLEQPAIRLLLLAGQLLALSRSATGECS